MGSQAHIASSYRDRAVNSIAQGALTNSKRPECLIKGIYPETMTVGHGCQVYDIEGNKYTDFICGLGTNLIGHGNDRIARNLYNRYLNGTLFSQGSKIEIEAAERIKSRFPFIHRLKFLKTGSEACSAAVKIARASKQLKGGKTTVLSDGYHGWLGPFDWLMPPAYGVSPHVSVHKLSSLDQVKSGKYGAVIIEPIQTDFSDERIKYLNELRELCDKTKTILIFDETITGYRFPKFSVSNHLGIEPDLIILGKAIGGGMPLAVVGGKKEIMNCGEYFVSSTFAGDTMALQAYLTMDDMFQEGRFDMGELWIKGKRFISRFNHMDPKIQIEGYPTRGRFVGDPMVKRLFWQEAARSFILFGPSFFFNFAHIGQEDVVINVCEDILTRIRAGEVKALGQDPVSPFAEKVRHGK